jgi:hypothetical protein
MDMWAGDYPKLIKEDVLTMPPDELFEWTVVAYAYEGRYGT